MKKSAPLFAFNLKYFILTIVLFLTEVFIGMYVDDQIIRPYGGDVLVVMLIYCFFKSFLNTPVLQTAIAVLLFSYVIETLQYFHFVERIGLSHIKIAVIVIGNYFAWADIVSYTIGIAILLFLERNRINPKMTSGLK